MGARLKILILLLILTVLVASAVWTDPAASSSRANASTTRMVFEPPIPSPFRRSAGQPYPRPRAGRNRHRGRPRPGSKVPRLRLGHTSGRLAPGAATGLVACFRYTPGTCASFREAAGGI